MRLHDASTYSVPGLTWDLSSIIAPVPVDEFFRSYYHQTCLHLHNSLPKFAGLMPWSGLNYILRHQRLDPPQLRLVKDGQPIPVESYIKSIQRRTTAIPKLLVSELAGHLRQGATLIIDKVDDMYEPIGSLATALEGALGAEVGVNLYAGWRTSRGFDLHWDDHDVFILQVTGKKHWTVYAPTVNYPIRHSPETDTEKPTGDPIWQGFLEAGDLLYIPRGWWHVAVPCDEPTLHLTVGLTTVTALDLLNWVRARLGAEEFMRTDVPRFDDKRAQIRFLSFFRDAITAAICDKDLLPTFYRQLQQNTEPRAALGLPWTGTPDVIPPNGDTTIELANAYPLDIRHSLDSGTIEVTFRNNVFTFHDAVTPLFEFLEASHTVSTASFHDRFDDEFGHQELRTFIADLVKGGILFLVDK
jgi:ribosomal protein L16 Arg81 hydroxylase